jgi:subtilisin family serine protease
MGPRDYRQDYPKKNNYYGKGKNQIYMLNGHYLHQMGYTGKGLHIAILDGGFSDMRRCPVFDSLWVNERVLGTHDFVEGDEFVYESSSHGRNVASCMASKLPGVLVGTAPDAAYYFFKTEDVHAEYRLEEYNWVAAIEEADRLGVDLVNSSLGYYDFDDDLMDYNYRDLDGKTAAISRAAKMASQKGMLIVSSAGNEGSGQWKKNNRAGRRTGCYDRRRCIKRWLSCPI